jgi:hypothetical protein
MTAQHIKDAPQKWAYASYLRKLRAACVADQYGWAMDHMSGWPATRKPLQQIRREARQALDRRINARVGDLAANAPMDWDLIRDARDLHDRLRHRVRVYQWRTELMRERFWHLLSRYDD